MARLYRVRMRPPDMDEVVSAFEWKIVDGWLIAVTFCPDGCEVESARFPEVNVVCVIEAAAQSATLPPQPERNESLGDDASD